MDTKKDCKRKQEPNIKIVVVGIMLCIMISALFCVLYVWDNERITSIGHIEEYEVYDNYVVIVDSIEASGRYYNIYGCALELGKDMNYANNHFVLVGDNGEIKKINTVSVKRESATEYFNDGYNYDICGLVGQVKKEEVLEGTTYKIGVLIIQADGKKYLKITDYMLSEGE